MGNTDWNMSSLVALRPGEIQAALPIARASPIVTKMQGSNPPMTNGGGAVRESLEGKEPGDKSDREQDAEGDADRQDNSSNDEEAGPHRKRRRSRKGLDKKFECPTPGCGKSYSRAEHLYRHQLNHEPKHIYKCTHPGCTREFVRQDLRNRHMDRHTAKGSALSRKDSMTMSSLPSGSISPETNRSGGFPKPGGPGASPYTPISATPPVYPHGNPPHGLDNYMQSDNSYGNNMNQRHPHQSPSGGSRPALQTNVGPYGVLSPGSTQHGSYQSQPINTPQSTPTGPYVGQNNFPPFTLPPSDFSTASSSGAPGDASQSYTPATNGEYTDPSHAQASGEMMLLDQMASQTTIPVFGPDGGLNKSPYITIPEDFITYLFNTNNPDGSPSVGHVMAPGQYSHYGDFQSQYNIPYYANEGTPLGYFPPSNQSAQVMSVTNLLDQNLPESLLSEEKSQEIFDFIKDRFHEKEQAPVERQRDSILDGDRSDEHHMLSRKMMQAYISSYWVHFSDQIPILHKPTFSPDKIPTLLLLAVMAIGASCLDRTHGNPVMTAGAQLSNFLAWHVRWEIFMDANSRPPAKLWIFQALLLLELYEKMYSTRELHERAHIHHATTITLMRRGRSLIGKSALDSPPNPREDKNGSRHSSTSGVANTPDEWWNHWITNESTRRAAFAAFLIDSIHATMFGHSTVMVAHEMRLPLPCDDQLWKAGSGAEVGRTEANLMSNGIKPISFLEGLKRTLNGQEVRTNTFGRQVLMAGLLSVSWHMNQRDLQVTSLGGGVTQALGGRDKWRGTLIRAFDVWKTDFDKSLQRSDLVVDPYSYERRSEANVVFESRTVLHHLAHMAMHVDIVDCQIFARAKRLLGRAIGNQDLSSAQRRMKDNWAPTAKARDATFYALKFLASVLLADETGPEASNGYRAMGETYVARDDVLLNRPWVLYFAALVVWCYGFALEGSCPNSLHPSTMQESIGPMKEYLRRFGSIQTPDGLKLTRGVNHNSALLFFLKNSFETSRWELLHEGAILLNNCIQLNSGVTIV